MKIHVVFARPFTLLPLALLLLPGWAVAQHEPVTGQMMDGPGTAAAAPPSTPRHVAPPAAPLPSSAVTAPLPAATAPVATWQEPAAPAAIDDPTEASAPPMPVASSPAVYYAKQVGDTTRHLLQMQVEGSQAGQPLPMLGAEASASYVRYMKSFEHPIPEFYETTVGKNTSGGR